MSVYSNPQDARLFIWMEKQCWESIGKEDWERFYSKEKKERWDKWLLDLKEHDGHPKEIECRGCGKKYCKHLDNWICITFPVCLNCDTFVDPNLFNPINKDLIEKYIPEKSHLF